MRTILTIVITAVIASGATALAMREQASAEHERAEALEVRIAQLSQVGAPGAKEGARAGSAAVPEAASQTEYARLTDAAMIEMESAKAVDLPVARGASAAAPASDEPSADERTVGRTLSFDAMLLKNPEYRAAAIAQRRAILMDQRPDLAAELGIPPAKANALFDLLAEQELITSEERATRVTNREQFEATRKAAQMRRDAVDSQIAALLGQQDYAELKQYQATFAAREHVIDLRSALAAGNEPLRQDQVDPLIAAISAEQQRVSDEVRDFLAASPPRPGEWQQRLDGINKYRTEQTAAAYDRVRASMSALLTPTQATALETVLRNDLIARDARARMARLRREARDSAPPRGN